MGRAAPVRPRQQPPSRPFGLARGNRGKDRVSGERSRSSQSRCANSPFFTISADLAVNTTTGSGGITGPQPTGGNSTRGVGLGFYPAFTDGVTNQDPFPVAYTGFNLQNNGTSGLLQLVVSGVSTGFASATVLSGTFSTTAFYNLTCTVNTSTGNLNSLIFNGTDLTSTFATSFSGAFRDSPEWGSACVLAPQQQYDFYADQSSIIRSYPTMKSYVNYLTTRASGYIVNYGLGDWYDIGLNPPGNAQLPPVALTATAIYYADARALASMAQMLGNTSDASTYTTLANNIQSAFTDRDID